MLPIRTTALAILVALTAQHASGQSLPKDFIAEKLGTSCSRYYSPGRLSSDLQFIAQLRGVSLSSNNSLTINHDAISKRWTRLLGVSYGVAARNDSSGAKRIVNTLVGLAQSNAMLNVMSVSEAKRVRCWSGGNQNSVCPFHVVQHSGYSAVAMIISASVLEEYIQPNERAVLTKYFDSLYKKFISPLSRNGLRSDGLYEFADYGIGVLAYARWKGDRRLAAKEIKSRRSSFIKKIEANGLIDNNSFRGYRGYWYHTLGAESALGYALVARRFGVDLFRDRALGPRLKNMATQTVNGGTNYSFFRSLPTRGDNAVRDASDEIPHMHQFAVNLPTIIGREYGYRVPIQNAYRSKSRSETISRLVGFDVDCYYGSR